MSIRMLQYALCCLLATVIVGCSPSKPDYMTSTNTPTVRSIATATPSTSSTDAMIGIQPYSGPVGTVYKIQFASFAPLETVKIDFVFYETKQKALSTSITMSPSGSAEMNLSSELTDLPGLYQVIANRDNSVSVQATFELVPLPTTIAQLPVETPILPLAATVTPYVTTLTVTTSANVRAGPGGYAIISGANRGDLFPIVGMRNCSDGIWYQIAVDDPVGRGWIWGSLVDTRDDVAVPEIVDFECKTMATPSPTATLAPTPVVTPSQQNSVNVDIYCKTRFGSAATAKAAKPNEKVSAFTWKCEVPSGEGDGFEGIDMNLVCQQQYGSSYTAQTSDNGSPYSWSCVFRESTPTPTATPIPQPVDTDRPILLDYYFEEQLDCMTGGYIHVYTIAQDQSGIDQAFIFGELVVHGDNGRVNRELSRSVGVELEQIETIDPTGKNPSNGRYHGKFYVPSTASRPGAREFIVTFGIAVQDSYGNVSVVNFDSLYYQCMRM